MGGGIVPDTFRIARKIFDSFENSDTGFLNNEFYVNVPADKYEQAENLLEELDYKIDWDFPFLDGVEPTVKDPFQ